MDLLLRNKNVLITGAGRNIGRAIALEMAGQGANVYFTDIDDKLCRALAQDLSALPVKAEGFVSDIAGESDMDSLCRTLEGKPIYIDILVNNVAISPEMSRKRIFDLDEWRNVFDVNLFGPLFLTRRIVQSMVQRKANGAILFISSIHQWSVRRIPCYSTSKAAIGMLVKELALELAPENIRVNSIAPGYVEDNEQQKPLPHRHTPLHRTSIPPQAIGRAAVYLSSDYFSRYTTGTTLKIDAGLSLYNHLAESKSWE